MRLEQDLDFLCLKSFKQRSMQVHLISISLAQLALRLQKFARIFDPLTENINQIIKLSLVSHCHDDLGMATANTLTAIKHGAGRVQELLMVLVKDAPN